jgi:acyl dehydratase
MHVSSRYVLQQGPMLATLGKTAARAFAQQLRSKRREQPAGDGDGNGAAHAPLLEAPEVRREFAPPSSDLLDAYVRHVGGEPRAYRGIVPAHFFPHWVLPAAAQTLSDVPYPILRVLNAGCRMQINAQLPRGQRLHVRARLTSIDDDGRRALLTQRVVTGTDAHPDALVTDLYVFVPLRRAGAADASGAPKDKAKDKARVPSGAREIASVRLRGDDGLSFAKLTGDFNPVHWVRPYAKVSGFRNVILHGFATFARSCEALNRGLFGGDVRKLTLLDAKFTRPLVLPHAVGFFIQSDELFVGDAVLGPAYMTSRFKTGDDA